jgi:outer membrane usher protein FimD/PapC
MDPYLIRYPVPSLAGQLPLPSDLEVYLDGSRIRSERLPPGPFELKNIAARQGAGLLEIVIRDPFGREQRIGRPYYVSDLLLQQGLSEYSYNVGFQRRSFGEKSFLYGSPVGTLFHRQGINDFLTLGVRGEAGSGIVNGGPLVSFLLGDSGVGTLALASSHDDHLGSGGLASASYSYSGRIISCRVAQRVATSNYGTLDTANGAEVVRAESAAGINLGIGSGASLSLDGTFRRGSSSGESRILALGYGRNLTENTFFNITYRILHNSETIQEIFAGLTWYPGRQTTVAASHEQHGSTTFDQIELQKNAPFGEGFGYRTALSHQEGAGIDDTSLTPSLQYRGQRGIASADLRFDSADRELYEEYRLSLAGAVTYVGGSTHLTRPVSDSFALVRVADAEGVRVLQNNQEVGRTDRHGELVVPSLTSYIDNELAINDQDLPLDYLLDSRHRHLSPSLRSGSCVMFGSGKLRAITGRMVAKSNSLPLEYASLVLTGADATCSTTTGRNGEFYMDSTFCTSSLLKSETEGCHTASSPSPLAAGTHAATLSMGDKVIPLTIVIPATDGPILELGTISCAGPADSPRIGGEGP